MFITSKIICFPQSGINYAQIFIDIKFYFFQAFLDKLITYNFICMSTFYLLQQ